MADLPTKDDQIHILRNCIANFYCSIIPYIEIIDIMWKTVSDKTLEEYFNSVGITEFFKNQNAERKWRDNNLCKLQKKSFETFDVTFLSEILPMICRDKIAKNGSPEQEAQLLDTSSVEWHLREIKKMRNTLSHESERLCDRDFFINLKNLIRRCLLAACTLYGITNKDDIDQMTNKADDKFESIIQKTTVDRESRVRFLKDLILSDCIEGMKDRVKNMMVSLPGNYEIRVELTQVFKKIYLSSSNSNFECHTLLAKLSKKFNIIKGRSGSGKTILMKTLYRAIVLGEPSNFQGSNKFKLALLITCQTDNFSHLGDYCKALLPKPFATFDKNEVLDSIHLIDGVIFLVDGFDEANERSRELTKSAIEFCRSSKNASCVISSRIKAANELKNDLSRRDLEYDLVNLEKIDDQNEQTEIIRSYVAQLPNVNMEEAVKKFKSLNQKVREIFNTPLLLAFFCTLYKTMVNESRMMNEVDVFRGIYKQILNGISQKLSNDGASDSASIIMNIICEHCMHLIGLGETVFSTENYEKLKASCKSVVPRVSNLDNLLENILIPNIPDNILHDTTYTFIHFSIHEFLSSLAIELKLKNVKDLTGFSKRKFIEILDLSPRPMQNKVGRYQNVFRFLILRLHSTGEIEMISVPMSEIMANDVQPDYPFCLDLISDTGFCNPIIEMISPALASHPSFSVHDVNQLRALVEALLYAQKILKMGTKDLMIGVTKLLTLNMRKSHDDYIVLDNEIFQKLEKLKCSINMIRICLDSEFSLGVLVNKLASNCLLYISCPSTNNPKLKILDGKTANTKITFKFCDKFPPGEKNPLPRENDGSPPFLHITDIPAHSQEIAFKIICCLAPADCAQNAKTFTRLYLTRCSLSAAEVNELVEKLSSKNFITENEGVTRAIKLSSTYDEICEACNAYHNGEDIPCYNIELSKSQYYHHLDLICAADFNESVIKQEQSALERYLKFEVKKIDHLIALSKVLNFNQQLGPHSHEVHGDQMERGDKSDQIIEIEIVLMDSYNNFQPLRDDIFQDLKSVRCSIIRFFGCLESSFSLNVLKSKLTKRSLVSISSPSVKDHNLSILDGMMANFVMDVAFKFQEESLGDSSFPIPRMASGSPPLLRVTDIPPHSQESLCRIISRLAPVESLRNSKTFTDLYLVRCSLSASDEKELMEKLSAKSFISDNEGINRIVKVSHGLNEYCEGCRDNHSEEDTTCYKLELSKSQYVHHLDLICASDFNNTVIKQEVDALQEVSKFEVKNVDHLTALCKVLNFSQQSSPQSSAVEVDEMDRGEKSGKIKEIEINLWDSFDNYQPLSDGIFQDLKSARCSIIRFIGCIESSLSMSVLKSKLTKKSIVHISSSSVKDHNLIILNGVETKYVMQFTFKYQDDSFGDGNFPLARLSTGCPPRLTITDIPPHSQETLCRIISSLAPVDTKNDTKTFNRLFLARCSISTVEAKELVEKLSAKNFLTVNEGISRAIKLSSGRFDYCEACNDYHREEDIICYKLELSMQYKQACDDFGMMMLPPPMTVREKMTVSIRNEYFMPIGGVLTMTEFTDDFGNTYPLDNAEVTLTPAPTSPLQNMVRLFKGYLLGPYKK